MAMSAIFFSVLEEPAPLDLQQIFCEGWVRPSGIKAEEFQRRDAVLRETITNLEYEPFCASENGNESYLVRLGGSPPRIVSR
jgi:hypothetical protein